MPAPASPLIYLIESLVLPDILFHIHLFVIFLRETSICHITFFLNRLIQFKIVMDPKDITSLSAILNKLIYQRG